MNNPAPSESQDLFEKSFSYVWRFSESENFQYDPDLFLLSDEGITLRPVDQVDDDDDSRFGFLAGTFDSSTFDRERRLLLSNAKQSSFTSRLIETGSEVAWDSVRLELTQPFGLPLPDESRLEEGFDSGNVNMAGNLILLHLDELSGQINDTSGLSNSPIQNQVTLYGRDGVFGRALGFDGVDDRLFISASESMDTRSEGTTLELWFKPDGEISQRSDANSSGFEILVAEGDLDSGWVAYLNAGKLGAGAWEREESGYSWSFVETETAVEWGRWHHLAIRSQEGGQSSLSLNGQEVDQLAAAFLSSSDSGIHFAAVDAQTETIVESVIGQSVGAFEGSMDEIALFARLLSDDEVLTHYTRGSRQAKLQIAFCDITDLRSCDQAEYLGPDGTTQSYFSASQASVSFDAKHSSAVQYRIYFDSMDEGTSAEVKSVSIGPDHYPSGTPLLVNQQGADYVGFFGKSRLELDIEGESESQIRFQISPNGDDWYYFDGSLWTVAQGSEQTNTAQEVSDQLDFFAKLKGSGTFFWKAYWFADEDQSPATLKRLALLDFFK